MGGEGLFVDDCRAEFDRFGVCHQIAPKEAEPQRIRKFVVRQSDVGGQAWSITNLIHVGKKHGERRYVEGTVTDGTEVSVLGYARAREDATNPLGPDDVVVGRDPTGDNPFVLSEVGEDGLVSRTRTRLVLAGVGAVVGLALLFVGVQGF